MNVSSEMASSTVAFFDRVLGVFPGAPEAAPAARKTPVGLSADQVRRLTAQARAHTLPTAADVRGSLIRLARAERQSRPGTWGRRGLPAHVVSAMYVEYQSGKSCTEVAAIFGGTRQSVHEVFRHHGMQLRTRKPKKKIRFQGRRYTMGKDYIRATEGDRIPLHHAMWIAAHGPIPEGHSVSFRNADRTDVRLDNLFCAPLAEVTRYHQRRIRS